ncbi:MAG: phospholipase D family protein, partial [Rhodobacter sp.]|nr:phospholipase D family protein [Rhodobacter sp.]
MSGIFSNGPSRRDFVINPLTHLIARSSRLHLAAPYLTRSDEILEAAGNGRTVRLLVGLNPATNPPALRRLHGVTGIDIRYFTSRFHAKIYVFDQAALLGSSNLTDGGLRSNREAVILLDQDDDADTVDDVRGLFVELWEAGHVLTPEKLDDFERVHRELKSQTPDSEKGIEAALGQAQPYNINVASQESSKERVFLESLRREVHEQYLPAFGEVRAILEERGFRRPDLANVGIGNETNRFLNYVRRIHATGDTWQDAPPRVGDDRREWIMSHAREWIGADDPKVGEGYVTGLETVKRAFGTREAIEAAGKGEIIDGLMSLHAFAEQMLFIKGGEKSLRAEFWKRNGDDTARVKSTLVHLLHGSGDFVERFHDVLYDPRFRLGRFGYSCTLELYG